MNPYWYCGTSFRPPENWILSFNCSQCSDIKLLQYSKASRSWLNNHVMMPWEKSTHSLSGCGKNPPWLGNFICSSVGSPEIFPFISAAQIFSWPRYIDWSGRLRIQSAPNMTNCVLVFCGWALMCSCYDTYLCGCLYLSLNVTALIDDFLPFVERDSRSHGEEGEDRDATDVRRDEGAGKEVQ